MAVDDGPANGPSKGWKWADAAKPAELSPAEAAAAGHPEAKMSAAAPVSGQPGLALPPAMVDETGQRKLVSPEVSQFMTTPLARPTGIDALDSFLSPSSLAMMTFSGGPKAVKAVSTAVADLTEAAGGALTKKVLKFVTPSLLKKPGELADILNEIGQAVKAKGAAAPQAPQAPAAAVPAPAEPIATPAQTSPAAAMPQVQPAVAPEAVAAKPKLTAPESKEYFRLRMAGKSDAEAKTAIEAARAFQAAHELTTPTAAETRFPKGMRGGVSQ